MVPGSAATVEAEGKVLDSAAVTAHRAPLAPQGKVLVATVAVEGRARAAPAADVLAAVVLAVGEPAVAEKAEGGLEEVALEVAAKGEAEPAAVAMVPGSAATVEAEGKVLDSAAVTAHRAPLAPQGKVLVATVAVEGRARAAPAADVLAAVETGMEVVLGWPTVAGMARGFSEMGAEEEQDLGLVMSAAVRPARRSRHLAKRAMAGAGATAPEGRAEEMVAAEEGVMALE